MKDLKSPYNQIYSNGTYSKYLIFKSHQEMAAIIEGARFFERTRLCMDDTIRTTPLFQGQA